MSSFVLGIVSINNEHSCYFFFSFSSSFTFSTYLRLAPNSPCSQGWHCAPGPPAFTFRMVGLWVWTTTVLYTPGNRTQDFVQVGRTSINSAISQSLNKH